MHSIGTTHSVIIGSSQRKSNVFTKLLTNTFASVLGVTAEKRRPKPDPADTMPAVMSEADRLRALLRSTIPHLVRQEVAHHIAAINAQIRRDAHGAQFERGAAGHCRATIDKIVEELKTGSAK